MEGCLGDGVGMSWQLSRNVGLYPNDGSHASFANMKLPVPINQEDLRKLARPALSRQLCSERVDQRQVRRRLPVRQKGRDIWYNHADWVRDGMQKLE